MKKVNPQNIVKEAKVVERASNLLDVNNVGAVVESIDDINSRALKQVNLDNSFKVSDAIPGFLKNFYAEAQIFQFLERLLAQIMNFVRTSYATARDSVSGVFAVRSN